MNKQTNSGKYVNYIDGRSTSRSSGLVFSSANGDALSSIIRNRSFYAEPIIYMNINGLSIKQSENDSWFWTESWQRQESEADQDLLLGNYDDYDTIDEFIASL